jgi:hypothetical protein
MTESEWLAGKVPTPMHQALGRKISARKLRLFAVACSRRLWHLPLGEGVREGVKMAERYAEGHATRRDLLDASRRTYFATQQSARQAALESTVDTARIVAFRAAEAAAGSGGEVFWHDWHELDTVELAVQADLLRDIAGNPFRPVVLDPLWLAAGDGIVPRLAATIYQERAFDRLPILGDALQDASCTDCTILDHCRLPGPHVRGCWLVDLILGKK